MPSILLEAGRHVASRGSHLKAASSVQSVLLENLRLNIKGGLELGVRESRTDDGSRVNNTKSEGEV